MEQEALKRKARLQALRESRQKTGHQAPSTIKLRSYEGLGSSAARSTSPASAQAKAASSSKDTVETSVDGLVEKAISERKAEAEATELDIAAIAPKKANWDLKRDLQKKLDELKPRNEAAVANIIRRRVQESGDTDDLAGAVAAHTNTMLS
ncbi:hypothetical protein GGI12_003439 [Dipsacomyces acuminosporus]|nr:hypothetical protein GGI12_003439 [Dipsacomyces acuminosporus]